MLFFAIIVADDLTNSFLGSRLFCWKVSQIASDGCVRALLRLLALILLILFLFLLPSLLWSPSTIEALRSWAFWFLKPGLGFLDFWVLYWLVLSTGFDCWRPTIQKAVLVGFASIKARLENGFCLSVDCFFN